MLFESEIRKQRMLQGGVNSGSDAAVKNRAISSNDIFN
jgi:hypothetical protein